MLTKSPPRDDQRRPGLRVVDHAAADAEDLLDELGVDHLGGRAARDHAAVLRAFRADTLWALAAVLWIATGLWRLFGGLEKGTAYYFGNDAFWTKMGLLVLVLLLEIVPMVTLIRWRAQDRRGEPIDTSRAALLVRISVFQAILVVLMVFAATAMARGIGA
jgi:putative membrane protein